MNTPMSKCFPEIKKRCTSPSKYYEMLRQLISSFPHPKGASVNWAILNNEWQNFLINLKYTKDDVQVLRNVFEQVHFGISVPIGEYNPVINNNKEPIIEKKEVKKITNQLPPKTIIDEFTNFINNNHITDAKIKFNMNGYTMVMCATKNT